MRLDKSKPFGEVWGDQRGARYHQNGHYFDADGNVMDLAAASGQPLPAQAPAPQSAQAPDDGAAAVEAALTKRHNELLLQAIPLLAKAQAEVVGELEDHDADLLKVMLEVEGLDKKRKTVIEGITLALAEKVKQAKQDEAAAAGQQPAAFGTLGAESQLNAQLSS